MIRYSYIYNRVLECYSNMPHITFPIEPEYIITGIPNVRMLSYSRMTAMHNCSIEDVILVCQSRSGCTNYDCINDRYLLIWNDDTSENIAARRRWTKAHELGHIMLKHLLIKAGVPISETCSSSTVSPEFETEADIFAATLLSPMPLFQILNITSQSDIMRVFGLSAEASRNRWMEYQKWNYYHRKTAWECDLRRLYVDNQQIAQRA